MRDSKIPQAEWPFQECQYWINANINFCFAEAKAWELKQSQVCSLCQIHNRARAIDATVKVEPTKIDNIFKFPRFRNHECKWHRCKGCQSRVKTARAFCYKCENAAGRAMLYNKSK